MKKFLLIFIASCLLLAQVNALIIEAPNLDLFEKAVENMDQQSLVLFDVDETLIVPKDMALCPCARLVWNQAIEEILQNPTIVAPEACSREYFWGQILPIMEYEIVDPKIVDIIHSLQREKIKTIAFTKMMTGPFGAIPSLEDWRFEQLKKKQLDFSAAFPQFQEISIRVLESRGRPSLFKQGVLYANRQDKGPVLTAFLENIQWKPSKVLFIDNRLDFLQSVETALEGTGIEFIGFHYTEVEKRPYVLNEDLVKFQLLHLAKTGRWLSDNEALKLME